MANVPIDDNAITGSDYLAVISSVYRLVRPDNLDRPDNLTAGQLISSLLALPLFSPPLLSPHPLPPLRDCLFFSHHCGGEFDYLRLNAGAQKRQSEEWFTIGRVCARVTRCGIFGTNRLACTRFANGIITMDEYGDDPTRSVISPIRSHVPRSTKCAVQQYIEC
jgi:hypothetical protein